MANLSTWLSDYGYLVSIGLAAAVLLMAILLVSALVRLQRMQQRYQALLSMAEEGNQDAHAQNQLRQAQELGRRVVELDDRLCALEQASRRHLQGPALMRFNPFRDTGGDQSFALVMADGEGNGAIISSLHSRDATRVYAKPLAGWKSSYPLTDEEQLVIGRARGSNGGRRTG